MVKMPFLLVLRIPIWRFRIHLIVERTWSRPAGVTSTRRLPPTQHSRSDVERHMVLDLFSGSGGFLRFCQVRLEARGP
jgi:hypothetical protein